jgi:hypothetical protein
MSFKFSEMSTKKPLAAVRHKMQDEKKSASSSLNTEP